MSDLEQLGRELARERDALLARVRPGAALNPVWIAAHRRAKTRLTPRMAMLTLGLSGAALGIWLMVSSRAPLRVTTGAGTAELRAGDLAEAHTSAAVVPLTFSDGSHVVLTPGSAARLTAVTADGARIAIERGSARVSVAHRRGAAWTFTAGPYAVTVTGTQFRLNVAPERRIDVVMETGSVRVTGPGLTTPRALRAGERLTMAKLDGAWAPDGDVPQAVAATAAILPPPPTEPESHEQIGSRGAAPVAPISGGTAGAATGRPVPPARVGVSARQAASAAAPSAPAAWRKLLNDGRYGEAMRELGNDFDSTCAGADAAELAALGKAARFGGDALRARTAYLALTRRFPDDQRTAVAMFTLGRIASELQKDHREAATWFLRYLRSYPKGELRAEAAGRLIEAQTLSGDQQGAQRTAREYLTAYPDGTHAEMARRVLGHH